MAGDKRKARPSKPSSRRRKLETTWSVLAPEELRYPGAKLIATLLERAYTRRIGMNELAKELGITYQHFSLVRRKPEGVPKFGDEVIERAARFLDVPKVTVMLLADQLKITDFDQKPEDLKMNLENALRFIQGDPKIGPYVPLTIFVADTQLQLLVVTLYELATGRVLIPSKKTPEEIAALHKEFFPETSE